MKERSKPNHQKDHRVPVSRKVGREHVRRFRIGPWRMLSTIAGRHRAGESIQELVEDYCLSHKEILGAIEWHKKRGKAAKKGWRTRRAGE